MCKNIQYTLAPTFCVVLSYLLYEYIRRGYGLIGCWEGGYFTLLALGRIGGKIKGGGVDEGGELSIIKHIYFCMTAYICIMLVRAKARGSGEEERLSIIQ